MQPLRRGRGKPVADQAAERHRDPRLLSRLEHQLADFQPDRQLETHRLELVSGVAVYLTPVADGQ